jgi:hypothetical protein
MLVDFALPGRAGHPRDPWRLTWGYAPVQIQIIAIALTPSFRALVAPMVTSQTNVSTCVHYAAGVLSKVPTFFDLIEPSEHLRMILFLENV